MCTQCRQGFEITSLEERLLGQDGLPIPDDCPACRRQQRLLFRNFFHLYHRTCDLTGKKIISMYDADVPFPVYATQEWWGDRWDGCSYGKDWNPDKPLFGQLTSLHDTVPRMSVMNTASENTDYCNLCFYSRNCYLVHGCVHSEDCMYGHIVWRSKDCYDCLYLYQCELCCECIDCVRCRSLSYSQDCDNCSDSMFLVHCVGCRDCFGCVGLKNKQYHIFNKPHSKEEYERKISQLQTGSASVIAMARQRLRQLRGKEIVKYYHGFNCENVTGDYLYNCRNLVEGYDLKESEDCAHIATCEGFKDCMDCNFSGTASERCHQSLTIEGYGLIGCHNCLRSNANLLYCDNCYSCKDCVGCIGLKSRQYCILNKQYTKEQYTEMKPKMLDALRRHGEWGKFLPAGLTPFGYNETIAYHYFPLTEEQTKARGWKWKPDADKDKTDQYLGPEAAMPQDIGDAGDDLPSKIFRCEESGKLFKILPQELKFYRQMRLPLPRKCFDARQEERFAARNPRRLFDRACAKCSKAVKSTYAPDRQETVYCEECYLSTVY